MASPEWHERLDQELKRRGLPPNYSARLLEELTDHFTDIQNKEPSMDALKSAEAKLGTPESLAAAAEQEYRKRTFAGRHPFLMFVVLPIPAAILMLTVITFVVILPCDRLSEILKDKVPASSLVTSVSTFDWIITYFNLTVIRYVPFVLTSLFFVRIGRHAKSPFWGLAACAGVACFAFIFRAIVEPPTNHGDLILRIGLNFEYALFQWQNGLVQMCLPLFVGLWECRKLENQFSFGKWILVAMFLFPIVCAVPIPIPVLKRITLVALEALFFSAILGSLWCLAVDRFGQRLGRA